MSEVRVNDIRVNDAGLLDPLAQDTRALELTSDARFLAAMVEAELALSRALVDVGIAPEWMLEVCEGIAAGSAPDVESVAAGGRGGGNPVIPLVTVLSGVADAIHPGASDFVHTGATSQDILDTAAMLVARSVCREVLDSLTAIGARLAELAERHRSTPLVGRTLGQHASPTRFGFVVAGWLDGVTAAIAAVDTVINSLPVQLGGAVGTRTVLDLVAAQHQSTADHVAGAYAHRLGLAAPEISWHSNRSPVLAVASALARATAAVGVIALDVTVLARTEISELSERTSSGSGGSSAMPHKSNPVTAVLITAAARRAPHALAAVFASAVGEDQRASGAWHAEWLPLRDLERAAVTACAGAADLVDRLEVDEYRMAHNLELTGGLVHSERLVAELATVIGRTEAFALVQRAARDATESGRQLAETVADLTAGDAGLGDAAARAFGDHDDPSADAAITRVLSAFDAAGSASASARQGENG